MVGSWRAEKRLAVTTEFPRAQYRTRHRLGGCLGCILHKSTGISASHTLCQFIK